MFRRGIGSTERCVWLTLLLVTGDVGPYATRPIARAHEIVAMVDSGDFTALPHKLSKEATHVYTKRLPAAAADIREIHGPSTGISVLEEGRAAGTFAVAGERGDWKIVLELARDGTIDHLELRPIGPPVARTPPLGLPFHGEWRVGQGGPTESTNIHADAPGQRRAADLWVVDSTGKTHRGDGKRNEDYFAYGRDIVAMADGVVLMTVDGVTENVPGERQVAFRPGNMVVLDHGNGLYTKYAHLIPGSLQVKPHEYVRRGQVLGRCGNSGNSSEPHLHVQAHDGPWPDESWGIEMVFEDVWMMRDGERTRTAEYTFLRGDLVSAG